MSVKERHRWKRRWSALMWQDPRYRWTFILCFAGLALLGHLLLWPWLSAEARPAVDKFLLPVWILVMAAFTAHFLQYLASRAEIRRQMSLPGKARRRLQGERLNKADH